MLTQIIAFIKQHDGATAKEIALHFQIDVSAVDGMLHTLEQKGRIEQIAADHKCACCKGCSAVDPSDFKIYKIRS